MPLHSISKHQSEGATGGLRLWRVGRFFRDLGPGLITGAADDDPSGIGTYSIAGAQFGFAALWTAWFSLPLMATMQLLCSRLSMISGRGLGELIQRRYGRGVLLLACVLLSIANVVNIGADFGAMAASSAMVTGIPAPYFTPLYTLILLGLMAWTSYRTIARIFKWMTLVLFSYVIAAFLARPEWHEVWRATLVPQWHWSRAYIAAFVAILGTTISPYLFFWQANQQVEEEVDQGRTTVSQRIGATEDEMRGSRTDVLTGAVLSNVIMFFIILTAGATLHAHGNTEIATTQQAAEALRPLAGRAAYLLFTLGIIGTGMLCVPVLAGSTAYAIAEAAHWRESLRYTPGRAPQFYGVLAAAFLIGLGLNFAHLNVVHMLFWSAVLNGILAPPLIFLIVHMASDPKVMGENIVSPSLRVLGWFTGILMTAAAVALFVS